MVDARGACRGVLSLTLHYSTANGSFSKRTYFSTLTTSTISEGETGDFLFFAAALRYDISPSGDHGLVLLCPYKTVSGQRASYNVDTQPD